MKFVRTTILTCVSLTIFTTIAPAFAEDSYPVRKYELEKKLKELKLPTGKVDGEFTEDTKRALCIWRELVGRPINRSLPSEEEFGAVQDTDLLFPRPDFHVGLNINRTCQSAIYFQMEPKLVMKVFRVSTGKPGFESEPGLYAVKWRVDDWYLSTIYPDGWMYRPMFFNFGQALHGSKSDAMVHTYPASHGCVRMFQRDIDWLWRYGLKVGSLVHIYGTWRG